MPKWRPKPTHVRALTATNDRLLRERGFCRRHCRPYALNVMNGGRIEAGKCPDCYPKPPAAPARSTK